LLFGDPEMIERGDIGEQGTSKPLAEFSVCRGHNLWLNL
jgi:hypothetical protein